MLLAKKVTILKKYLDFANLFSKELIRELPKCFDIYKHAIDLEFDKELFYGPINSLSLIELKTLKIYINTNISNNFICLLKSPTKALILFVQK